MDFRTLYDYDFSGKRVLVRVDFNVPLDENRQVVHDGRIRAALPTLRYLQQQGAKVILLTHTGRPKGNFCVELQTDGIAHRLSQLLGTYVHVASDCVGPDVAQAVASLSKGEVLMLQNVRFYEQEYSGNNDFARQLASLADYFVQDAFGVCHREQASVTKIPLFIPSCAGFLLQKELDAFSTIVANAPRPFVKVIGGAKKDKIKVIRNLLDKVDRILVGGILANTFLFASGKNIGASKYDKESVAHAQKLLAQSDGKILLPIDVVVADTFSDDAQIQTVNVGEIPNGWMILDIGPQTRAQYSTHIGDAATIMCSGPLGAFEMYPFSHGTKHIAEVVGQSAGVKIIGGGDSAAAVEQFKMTHHMSLVSTGGGASLHLLQGSELPGVSVLIANKKMFSELCVQ